jgi:hypothetical protein
LGSSGESGEEICTHIWQSTPTSGRPRNGIWAFCQEIS